MKDTNLTVRVTRDELDRYNLVSEQEHYRSLSDWVRDVLNKEVDRVIRGDTEEPKRRPMPL